MADIHDLIEAIRMHGLEYLVQRYYGFYEANVTSNKDPEQRGRIQLACPKVGHNEKNPPDVWVPPAMDAGSGHGTFFPPEVGDTVRVSFALGDPSNPQFYIGGYFGKKELPSDLKYSDSGFPERRGIVTRGGHELIFVDEPGKERINLQWHQRDGGDPSLNDRSAGPDMTKGKFATVSIDSKGSIQILNSKSSFIALDADLNQAQFVLKKSDGKAQWVTLRENGILINDSSGDFIEINSKTNNITITSSKDVNIIGKRVNLKGGTIFLGDGATFSGILGEPFLALFQSHTHTTSSGPSGPPVPLPTPALLSKKVKLG